jgi:hypothetical protein
VQIDQGALALLIREKKMRLVKQLILEIANKRLQHNGS